MGPRAGALASSTFTEFSKIVYSDANSSSCLLFFPFAIRGPGGNMHRGLCSQIS